jgi:hypothetical protein
MSFNTVNWILGGAGKELIESELPHVADARVPNGLRPVVAGEKYFRWGASASFLGSYLVVSFEDGVVKERYYWEPSY